MAKRLPPSQRPERQLDPAAQEAARLAEEEKADAKKALKAERRAENIRPTHDAGSAGLSGGKSASAGSQPQIRRSKSGGGG